MSVLTAIGKIIDVVRVLPVSVSEKKKIPPRRVKNYSRKEFSK